MFNDYRFPHIARGDFMWKGYAVVISPNIPREHVGDEVKPIMPHPIVQWFERLFRMPILPVCFVRGDRIEVDGIYEMQGKLFMSAASWARIRNLTTPPNTEDGK